MGRKGSLTGAAGRRDAPDPRLQDVADFVEDRVMVVDTEYRVRFANRAMREGCAEDAPFLGERCYEVFQGRKAPCSPPLWRCPLARVRESGEPATIVFTRPSAQPGAAADGYVKIVLYPLRDGTGEVTAIAEVRRDVTAERELEKQILRRYHHLHALSRISTATSGLWDLDAILNIALDTVLEIVDATTGGILLLDEQGQRLSYRVYRGLSATYVEQMQMKLGEGVAGRVAATGEPIVLEDVSMDQRAARLDLVSTEGLKGFVSVPLKAKDTVLGVMNVGSRMTGQFSGEDMYLLNSIGCQLGTALEQARLYERLDRARDRYRSLLRHALKAQEEERKRIARELHDETSQAITSLTLNIQAAIATAEARGIEDRELMDRLERVQAVATHSGNEIVRLMKELRPTLLDELGLAAAINRYARDNLESLGTSVAADFKGVEKRLPPEVEVTLFRIAQGAIGNIMEHAEARNVSIGLDCDETRCVLGIRDDGRGFDVKKLTRVDSSGRGAGLFTMKERAKLVGGACKVESRRGKGTRMTVTVPLKGAMPDAEDDGIDSG